MNGTMTHPMKLAHFVVLTLLVPTVSLTFCLALTEEPIRDAQSVDALHEASPKSSPPATSMSSDLKDTIQTTAIQAATLRAWHIHWEPKSGSISAVGDVELKYDKFLLRANQVQYDVKSSCVVAQDGATLLMGDELTLVSESLSYNLNDRRGSLASVKASYGAFNFAAYKASMLGDSIVLEDSKVTTCNRAHPHFELTAKRIQVVPGGQVILDGLSGRIYGLHLPTLPRYRLRIGDGGGGEFPFIAHINSADGVYAGFNYSRQLGGSVSQHPLMLSGTIGLSAKETWRGKISLLRSWGHGEAHVGVAHKDTMSDELARRLFLDALPEVGINGAYDISRGGFSLYGDISWGRYTERYVKRVSSPRVNIQLGLRNIPRNDGYWRWNFDLLLRYSLYRDDELKLARLLMGLRGRVGRRIDSSIMVLHHIQSGRTPFEFDDVDIRTECRMSGHVWLTRDRWKLTYDLRYDPSQWKMRDWSVGVVYRAHCIEWGLTYRLARREVRLVIDLVGITVPK